MIAVATDRLDTCSKFIGDGYWDAGRTHLHELRIGQSFTVAGKRGKLLVRGVGACIVSWESVTQRFNVASGRYRTQRAWVGRELIAPCAEVETEAPCRS